MGHLLNLALLDMHLRRLGPCRWTLPTNIPVPLLNGKSLFGEFLGSIAANLAQFPKGPALEDRFWLYFAVYHVGLFTSRPPLSTSQGLIATFTPMIAVLSRN